MVTLKNWKMIITDTYRAPECQIPRLTGQVFNHPNYPDGHTITTSSIIEFFSDGTCRSYNRLYKVQDPDPHWAQWCKDNGYFVPTNEKPWKLI